MIPAAPELIDQDTAEIARIYRQLRETDELIACLESELAHLTDPAAKQRWLKARERRRELHLEALKKLLEAQN